VVEAGRSFAAGLAGKLNEEGLQTRYPLIIWRDRDGFMKACACSDSRSWTFIRDDLDAPDRVETPGVAPGDPAAPLTYPGDGSPETLPYPNVAPVPPAGGAVPAPTPGTAPGTAPIAPRPGTPPVPRKAPEPRQTEDTTFF
ncbi:MAG: hypothetical protein ACXW3K_07145, partial [Brevundimonas sp.]